MTARADELGRLRETILKTAPDCGDNSCRFAVKRGGMRTNGGCRCVERSTVHWSDIEKYAAVASPTVVLALLDRLEKLEAVMEAADKANWHDCTDGHWALSRKDGDRIMKALTALGGENDER